MRHKWGPEVELKYRVAPYYQREMQKKSTCATCGITKIVRFIEFRYVGTHWQINDELYVSKRTPECQKTEHQLTLALK